MLVTAMSNREGCRMITNHVIIKWRNKTWNIACWGTCQPEARQLKQFERRFVVVCGGIHASCHGGVDRQQNCSAPDDNGRCYLNEDCQVQWHQSPI